jgi:hypothetical protein
VRRVLVATCIVLGAWGCRASVHAEGDVSSGKSKDLMDQPIEPATDEQAEAELDPSAELALIGARHDLRLAPNVITPSCKCLAVAVGAPDHAAFLWIGAPPAIDPSSQLVIAFSSDGIACPGQAEDSLGASYWGYRREGEDIVVSVENAKLGRPITAGAIIPRPSGAGRVRVRPASKQVQYGRPLDATHKDCTLR